MPRLLPTQNRGPAPNGMYAYRGRSVPRGGSNRSGSNRSGSSQNRGCRCRVYGQMSMSAPAGTW